MANQTLQQVLLTRIYLDPDNPRHETLPDEPSIIKHLVSREKVRALAKSIAEEGGTSPIELIALVKHPKVKTAYVVVEGNRRICALKLLQDPDKAGSENNRRYFAHLAQGMRHTISKVNAMVFDTRDDARRWFALRHEGEQDGVGTKAWDADQKTRFSVRTQGKNPNAQALLVLDYARQHKLLNTQEVDQLNITTLTRYLSNPVMRHSLGLADGNTLDIEVPDVEFERALTRFLRDALTPQASGVTSRTSAADRKAYANKLIREGVAATTLGGPRRAPRSVGDASISPPPEYAPTQTHTNGTTGSTIEAKMPATNVDGGTSLNARDNRNPDKRNYVISPSFRAPIKHKQLKRLFDELKKIDALQFGFAATYLLRAVLENGIAAYLRAKSVTPHKDLHEKYKQLVTQLQSEGVPPRELKFLRTIALNGRDDAFSPDTLGHYIHGGATPSANYAMRYWDNMESIMARVLQGQ
jgi:hypothetical protein